jgi:hypothetical protein
MGHNLRPGAGQSDSEKDLALKAMEWPRANARKDAAGSADLLQGMVLNREGLGPPRDPREAETRCLAYVGPAGLEPATVG